MVFHRLLHGKHDVERVPAGSSANPAHAAEVAYYACDGMSALVYDAVEEHLIAHGTSPCLGDEAYYLDLAARFGGPILEVGAGTGRLSWALAEAGHHVVGVDVAPAMLRQADAKRESRPAEVAMRTRFILEDLRRLKLGRTFRLIIAPYRTINLLTTAEDQRHALTTLARHLAPDGEMVLHMLTPEFRDWAEVMDAPHAPIQVPLEDAGHRYAGHRVEMRLVQHAIDSDCQLSSAIIDYTITASDGATLRHSREALTYRWCTRQEMRYLAELVGLEAVEERTAFTNNPSHSINEQIWVMRHRNAPLRSGAPI